MQRRLLILWHRFLARGFQDTIGCERVFVKSESPIGSEPPKVDTVPLRRETPTWTEAQRAMLPDGIRDNELRDEPHNALVKAFASRQKEKAKAFRLLGRFWRYGMSLLPLCPQLPCRHGMTDRENRRYTLCGL